MFVFNGGLTLEQVKKLENDEFYIYEKVPEKDVIIPRKNTFDYIPEYLYSEPIEEIRKFVSEDCYKNQYIFLSKFILNAGYFCRNSTKQNYIIVFDIDEEILNQYVGVGKYVEYLIEFRLPRAFITSENIKEILYYEPIDYSTLAEARLKYAASFSPTKEADQEAHELIKEKKLVFNEDKWL